MYMNYSEIRDALRRNEPFEHSGTMTGRVNGDRYEVYSYRTLIAYRMLNGAGTWLTGQKYSKTTSRQCNIIRRAWGLA